MATYLYADTSPLFSLGKAGLLDTLLPSNNGGQQVVITQEVYQELQDAPPAPGVAAALNWINQHSAAGDVTLLTELIVSPGANLGERSIAAAMQATSPIST